MRELRISDVTLKQSAKELGLSFKEKIELSKLLDRLGVDVIELEAIGNPKIDSLLIKSIATAVRDSVLAVPVELNEDSIRLTWNALKTAKRPRLQVVAGVSPVVMEYVYRMKPEAMLRAVEESLQLCRQLCEDVEFVAYDATRSDGFLEKAIQVALDKGASTITLCDTAGAMLPDEFTAFLKDLYEAVPELRDRCVAVSCSDELAMADSCAIAAVRCGAGEVKAAAYAMNTCSLAKIARVLSAKSDRIGASCRVRTMELKRITAQIQRICNDGRGRSPGYNGLNQENGEEIMLSVHDDPSVIRGAVEQLGYSLAEEDHAAVYDAFSIIASKKERVTAKELDAIVASAAMQVPPTYILEQYVITSGNSISSTAHLKLNRAGQILEGVCLGDGPIDAAFLAIEQIVGRHFELDDFQIQSVTEGREAMGQTLVKLRSEGKLYSGHGISTDIVGASIRAYLSALNKIVYEEEGV
ncbi:MAG: hypothetical protein J6K89_06155 [Oscillospiraceae bacterium]|nr:hypothetical protein [Oscillospiraceae bacterium]